MSKLPNLDRQTSIAVIAAGRLGSSMAGAMLKAGFNVVAISSRRDDQREWLTTNVASTIPGQHPGPAITAIAQTAADLATVVFITGPDSAIEEICDGTTWRADQAVLHCSGALPVSVLTSASERGASVGGFHPLQTFPSPDSWDRLKGVSCAIEAENREFLDWLKFLTAELGGSSVEIESVQRAAYHASAVMACGLVSGLVGIAAEMWDPLGLGRDEALQRLIPLLRSTVDSLEARGLPSAITGPFVRGDVETINSHIDATSGKSPETGRAYVALALASLHIAREQGGLNDDAFERIQSALSSTIRP